MLKFYLRLVVPTVVVCIVASAGLAGTYALTKDAIAAQEKAAQEKALRAVLPDAEEFEQVVDPKVIAAATAAAGETPVKSIFQAKGAGGVEGWGVIVTPRGYGGPMTVVVGVDRDGKVTGLNIVAHNETPGLGTKVVGTVGGPTTPYLEGMVGMDSPQSAAKADTMTGATKSSRGVKNAVEAALLVYSDVLSGGGEPK